MGALHDLAVGRTGLQQAWEQVLQRDRADGKLTAGVTRFAIDAQRRLDRLAESLVDGSWRASTLTEVKLPRPGGATRRLQVPPVRDRIVARAVLSVLTPLVDPLLGPACYAYRPGLGVADAVDALARLRDEGLAWVVRADVHDCFDFVPVDRILRELACIVDDTALVDLVRRLSGRLCAGSRGLVRRPGVPQGCPLSPLLANLALVHVDERMLAAGFPLVRYADDLAVTAATREEAWEALRLLAAAVEEAGMTLGADKTEIMSFDQGFCFLGEDFGPRYPPVDETLRTDDPERRSIYVARQGCRVSIERGRLVVTGRDDKDILQVPTGHLARIVCFGAVGITAGTRSWALNSGVEIVVLSRRGAYLGHIWPAASRSRVARLRLQLRRTEDQAVRMRLARAVVEAKVRKQIVLLQRASRRGHAEEVDAAITGMRRLLDLVPASVEREDLMGLEGAAARAYFAVLGRLVPERLRFDGRSRQPPRDLVNSALSYGYAILLGEAVSALCGSGLDPAIGFLHADHENRPSLALDLMEEFRPLIVDQVVLAAARKSELRPEHGTQEPGGGVFLTRAGREVVIDGVERRLLQQTRGALPGFGGSWRRHLYRQAERLGRYIDDPTSTWTGLSWR